MDPSLNVASDNGQPVECDGTFVNGRVCNE